MEVNFHKSVFLAQNIKSSLKQRLILEFIISFNNLEEGMKYLGFCLKPNGYRIVDWNWFIEKVVKRINNWTFRWLSLGGRLILVKDVLQSIHVYWFSLAKVPTSIIHKIQQLMAICLWRGEKKKRVFIYPSGNPLHLPKNQVDGE
jgi:hypothetical protein